MNKTVVTFSSATVVAVAGSSTPGFAAEVSGKTTALIQQIHQVVDADAERVQAC